MTPEEIIAKLPDQWVAIQRKRIIASSGSLGHMIVNQLPLLGEFAHEATIVYIPVAGEPTDVCRERLNQALDSE